MLFGIELGVEGQRFFRFIDVQHGANFHAVDVFAELFDVFNSPESPSNLITFCIFIPVFLSTSEFQRSMPGRLKISSTEHDNGIVTEMSALILEDAWIINEANDMQLGRIERHRLS